MSKTIVIFHVLATLVVAASFARAADAWQGAGIGTPCPTGSDTWDGTTMQITGAGEGLNVKGKDNVYFVHVAREAGDFQIVARLADFTGESDSTAGMMVRTGDAADGPMTSLFFKAKENTVGWLSRVPGASSQGAPQVFASAIPLVKRPPLWLKMVRLGKNFIADGYGVAD